MSLYLIPLQICICAASGSGRQELRHDQLVIFAALGFYGLMLAIWLNFAAHAYAWLPYCFYILEPF